MAFRFAPHYHLQARAQQAASITINYSIYNIHVSYSDKAPYYCLWDLLFFVYPESFFWTRSNTNTHFGSLDYYSGIPFELSDVSQVQV